jgi:transcriptional regulator with XRE-family HTH domain
MVKPSAQKRAAHRSLEIAFGRALRRLRRERGLSQVALAFASGYDRTYIGMLERGQCSPSLRTVFNLSSTLRIRPSVFVKAAE